MILPRGLEAHQGNKYMKHKLDAELQNTLRECPPVSPHLIAHLRHMFQDPTERARPNNPQLAQLLTIQYGVDKVLLYLEKQYDQQSAAAREERGI